MLAAPWRIAVPKQSAPVSPPPKITTCFPVAFIGGGPVNSSNPCLFPQGRYSIAW